MEKIRSIVKSLLNQDTNDIVRSFQDEILLLTKNISGYIIKLNFQLEKGSPELVSMNNFHYMFNVITFIINSFIYLF